MADVILVDPPNNGRNLRPQLGTLHLAAMLLQAGFEPALLDFTVEREPYAKLERLLRARPICVGISTVIGPMIHGAIQIAQFVRRHAPGVPIAWGGVHPTTAPDSTIASPLVDSVCVGEGEVTFPLMVEAYRAGRGLDDIPGILFKRAEAVVRTPPRDAYFDLDSLPILPYHLIDLDKYRVPDVSAFFFGLSGRSALSIETSRGCAYRCEYCVNAARREKFRAMGAKSVIRHMAAIVDRGVDNITINDDNFFVDKPRAMEILSAVVANRWKVKFFVAVRSDTLNALAEEEWGLLKSAGVAMFGIGVESGSDRVLEDIRKAERIADTFQANAKLARHGIHSWIHFLYGFPGEKIDDMRLTHSAMARVLRENPYARVNLNRLIPNPGTPSFAKCVACGWTPPATLEGWANVVDDTRSGCPAYIDPEVEAYWRANLQGISFPAASLERKKPAQMALLEAYLAKCWALMGRQGPGGSPLRVVVFGAGRHTAWLEGVTAAVQGPEVVAVVDDDPSRSGPTYWGRPVIPAANAPLEGIDRIILSSYYFADAMAARCEELFGSAAPVANLYEGLPAGLNPPIP